MNGSVPSNDCGGGDNSNEWIAEKETNNKRSSNNNKNE